MSDQTIRQDIASHYLRLTPAEFEAWLQSKCPASDPPTLYNLFLSAYLGGTIRDVEGWARDNAGDIGD